MPQKLAENSPDIPQALVVERADHPISRKHIDQEALKVMHRLRDAGFSAYLVGGGVRDLYQGKAPKDFDISTDARPGQIRKLFRNSRIIGRRFRLVQVIFHGNKIIELSTLRCSSEHDLDGTDKVLAANNTFGTLAEDAFRRDLTINALFYEIENFTIIDYTGGVADLKNKLIRIVGDPQRRITRDPVRMLRAIRHAARSGFTIVDSTWQAIIDNADKLTLCPDSRVRDELLRDLCGGASRDWYRLAAESGIFHVIMPCYKGIRDTAGGEKKPLQDLLALLAITDRLYAGGQQLPEHIIIALLLIPWACATMDLMASPVSGTEAFNFSRQLRKEIRKILAHLNIKRADQEMITGLLVGLPLLAQHAEGEKWPAKLSKKSYFQETEQFYRLYSEINGGEMVQDVQFAGLSSNDNSKPRQRSSRRNERLPVFANNTKGGVFGFRK